MVKDAELHVDTDRRKKALVEAKNSADALIYTTEKQVNDMGATVDGSVRMEIDAAVADLKQALKGEDPENIRRRTDALTRVAQKLTASTAPPHQGAGHGGGGASGRTGEAKRPDDDDVVDAEFQEVA